MKKQNSILNYEIVSTIFVLILGVILHFAFEWSNKNLLVGVFSAVNESTWEHLKLLFFPMLITIVIGTFLFSKDFPNYLCSKTKGIVLSMLLVVILFYTYTGIIGKDYAVLNIVIFFISVILGEVYIYKKISSNSSCNNLIAVIILLVLFLCFIIFTFSPPKIGIFIDPVTGV